MMIPSEKLREWAETVDPSAAPYIIKFVDEAEAKAEADVKSAQDCLRSYGFKVYEDQQHRERSL